MAAFDQLLDGLRAAAEPTRLRLIALLTGGELTVGEIAEVLGQSQPRVSRHLRLLSEAGLVERLPEGAWVFYRLAHGGSGGRLVEALLKLLPKDHARLDRDRERLAVIRARRGKAAADYFRQNARRWDELSALYVDEAEVEQALLQALGKGGIDDLLDIGTGTGRILNLLGPRIARGVGIDSAPAMLAIARFKLAEAGLRNCHVRQGDMYDLPWPGQSFDAVTIHQVLHFAERPAAVIAEAARMLRPGGRLVIADFAPHRLESLRSEHSHRRLGFADREVVDWLAEAGLKPGKVRHLSGKALTVSIWVAQRPGPEGRRPAWSESERLKEATP
jgi:ubiquinone/menaquinone biosynthesis C-methylase UbiE/DNA-binding transcriptional ArsR family regulator